MSMAVEAANLYLKNLQNPCGPDIKKIGSMQRKFNQQDWSKYMSIIKDVRI